MHSPEWTDLALSASPCVVDVLIPYSSLRLYIGLTLCLSSNQEPRTGPRVPSAHKQKWADGSDHLTRPASLVSPNAVPNAVDLWHKGMLMAHGELLVHQDPKAPSIKLLSGQLANSIWWMQLLLSMCRTWNFFLLSIMEFLLAHSLSLMRSLWTVAQPLFFIA